MSPRVLRLAFCLSGRGTTLLNLLRRIERGLPARVVKVVSSRSKAGGLEIAREAGIPTAVVRVKDHPDAESFSRALTAELDAASPDYVVFGGFLCYYAPPPHYRNRIINVHPALLPAFGGKGMYGERVHRAVIEHGVKVSGCTVHFVDEHYDHGPIIAQHPVRVRDDDTPATLAARVRRAERVLLPRVIELLAQGRVVVEGRKVRIIPPAGRESNDG
ncbi:MAG: phosphoribosylglycinamide formyltransferase [Planctomycetota bacterium]|nr:MAG: phosphoribosylglycinamide formyltransferase [Planctomycetota bacterium]